MAMHRKFKNIKSKAKKLPERKNVLDKVSNGTWNIRTLKMAVMAIMLWTAIETNKIERKLFYLYVFSLLLGIM